MTTPCRRSLRIVWAILAATLAGSGCPDPKAHDVAAARSCASNQDCDQGWACLTGRCYDTRKSAAFTHPEQQVTPDKVRQEVEHQQEQHMQRIDKELQGAGAPGN